MPTIQIYITHDLYKKLMTMKNENINKNILTILNKYFEEEQVMR